jgi:hypothetical protein
MATSMRTWNSMIELLEDQVLWPRAVRTTARRAAVTTLPM